MTITDPAAREGEAPGFIRGGGGVALDARRVLTVVGALGLAVLIAVTVAVTVSTAGANARTDRLRADGVPVTVTVTRCLGISSGVGMGIEYWQCRGAYTLGSGTYEEVIGGQRSLLEAGQRIGAVAVPGQPSLVSVPSALRRRRSYTLAWVLGGVSAAAAVGGVGLAVRSRRRA